MPCAQSVHDADFDLLAKQLICVIGPNVLFFHNVGLPFVCQAFYIMPPFASPCGINAAVLLQVLVHSQGLLSSSMAGQSSSVSSSSNTIIMASACCLLTYNVHECMSDVESQDPLLQSVTRDLLAALVRCMHVCVACMHVGDSPCSGACRLCICVHAFVSMHAHVLTL